MYCNLINYNIIILKYNISIILLYLILFIMHNLVSLVKYNKLHVYIDLKSHLSQNF